MEKFTKAYSKINLALNVFGIKDNGYHDIDTIICPLQLYDRINIEQRSDKNFSVEFTNTKQIVNDNTLKLLHKLRDYNINGYNIKIAKNIPLSSGLGGSSADPAAVARVIEKIENITIDKEILNSIGSDVYAMYKNENLRLNGDSLYDVKVPKYYIAILYSDIFVSSKDSFELFDKIGGDHINIDGFIKNRFTNPVNSLEKATSVLCGDISAKRDILTAVGYKNIVMSGSGNSVIAYEEDNDTFTNAKIKLLDLLKSNQKIKYLLTETLQGVNDV